MPVFQSGLQTLTPDQVVPAVEAQLDRALAAAQQNQYLQVAQQNVANQLNAAMAAEGDRILFWNEDTQRVATLNGTNTWTSLQAAAAPPQPPIPEIPLSTYWWAAHELNIVAAFNQSAIDFGIASLKDRCRLLGIPWVARLVPAGAGDGHVVQVLRWLTPSAFAQTIPLLMPENIQLWAGRIVGTGERHAHWMAHHALALPIGTLESLGVLDYIRAQQKPFPKTKSPKVVIEESREWHRRMAEMAEITALKEMEERERRTYGRVLTGSVDYPFHDHYEAAVPVIGKLIVGQTGTGIEGGVREMLIESTRYRMEIIKTRARLRQESAIMGHCVGRANYWDRIENGTSIIGHVTRDRKPMATVEFGANGGIKQAHGPKNAGLNEEVKKAIALLGNALGQEIAKATKDGKWPKATAHRPQAATDIAFGEALRRAMLEQVNERYEEYLGQVNHPYVSPFAAPGLGSLSAVQVPAPQIGPQMYDSPFAALPSIDPLAIPQIAGPMDRLFGQAPRRVR